MADRTAAALAALLDDERAAILTGDYAALGPLSPRKARLTEALARAPVRRRAYDMLMARTVANQRLLEAAAAGFRAAQRTDGAPDATPGFAAYGSDGARARLMPGPSALVRKA